MAVLTSLMRRVVGFGLKRNTVVRGPGPHTHTLRGRQPPRLYDATL
ncbi:hypothetical protein ACIA8E_39720 [Streptomyces sp. NPDC051664]